MSSRRSEPRITVRQAPRFDAGNGYIPGVAFNVRRSGIFIQCDGNPRPQGTEVHVDVPLEGTKTGGARLTGVVCWTGPGGIGLELAMTEDGDTGRLWETWIVEETLLGFG
jgi:hypothetical protein